MAMKIYRIGGLRFQYEEGEQPKGAVEVVPEKPAPKKRTPQNKAKAAADKAAE